MNALSTRKDEYPVFGTQPCGQIDHINGDKTDNKLSNLRDVAQAINRQNQKHANAGSGTGLLGVSKRKDGYSARIGVGRKSVWLGLFKTPEAAHAAYLSAKRDAHEGCTI